MLDVSAEPPSRQSSRPARKLIALQPGVWVHSSAQASTDATFSTSSNVWAAVLLLFTSGPLNRNCTHRNVVVVEVAEVVVVVEVVEVVVVAVTLVAVVDVTLDVVEVADVVVDVTVVLHASSAT